MGVVDAVTAVTLPLPSRLQVATLYTGVGGLGVCKGRQRHVGARLELRPLSTARAADAALLKGEHRAGRTHGADDARRRTCLVYLPREFRAQLPYLFVLSTYIGSLDTETAALFNNNLSEKRRQIKIKLSKD